jgi:hypothetical protein
MNYAVETSLCVVIYIPSFIQTDSGIQKLIEGKNRYTGTQISW